MTAKLLGSNAAAWKRLAEGWHLSVKQLRQIATLHTAAETKQSIGCNTPSAEFHYFNYDGSPVLDNQGRRVSRFRLADPAKTPNGKESKYRGLSGSGVALYIPHGLRRRVRRQIKKHGFAYLYIAEGEAKAEYAMGKGRACVGTQGWGAWQAQGTPAEQFAQLPWKQLRVRIIPDSDYQTNPDVRRGYARCGKHVQSLKPISVRMVLLPTLEEHFNRERPEKSKTGMDDYLAIRTNEQLQKLPRLRLDHKYIQTWDPSETLLPAALYDLEPIDPDWLDKELPPAVYRLWPYLIEDETAQVAGQAGTSKSTWCMYGALAAASGTKFFGMQKAQPPIPVMYAMLERNEKSCRRRIRKVFKDLCRLAEHGELRDHNDAKITPAALRALIGKNLWIKAMTGAQLRLVKNNNMQWELTGAVDALIGQIRAFGAKLFFLDPLSRLHGGTESSEVMSAMTQAFERMALEAECTIAFAHHAGIEGRPDSKYGGRGSSVLTDNTSENINFQEFKGTERAKCGDFMTALLDDETACDIIKVLHTRCSDGPLAPDMFLVRRNDGTLRRVEHKSKTTEELALDIADTQWDGRDTPFTKSVFAENRLAIFGRDISRDDARKLFDLAVEQDVLEKCGKPGRGMTYTIRVGRVDRSCRPPQPTEPYRRKRGKRKPTK
jgi:hypothetical protein